MTDAAPFLTAIADRPDDDAPRLVYADWLDERGDADRAEFIRLQCQLAQLEEYDPARLPLELRERALLEQHEEAWRGELPGCVTDWEYRRGFLDDVEANFSEKLSNWSMPAGLKRLTLNSPPNDEIERNWQSLSFDWEARERFSASQLEIWQRFFRQHHSARLCDFGWSRAWQRRDDRLSLRPPPPWEAMATADSFSKIRCLRGRWVADVDWLQWPPFTGVTALASVNDGNAYLPFEPNLCHGHWRERWTELHHQHQIPVQYRDQNTDDVIRALANCLNLRRLSIPYWPERMTFHWQKLESLSIEELDGDSLVRLSNERNIDRLRHLKMHVPVVTSDHVASVRSLCERLPGSALELDLPTVLITSRLTEVLRGESCRTAMRGLRIRLTDSPLLGALADGVPWPHLVNLSLPIPAGCKGEMRRLLSPSRLPRLRRIGLVGAELPATVGQALLNWLPGHPLRWLSLRADRQIDPAVPALLAEWPGLAFLEGLAINTGDTPLDLTPLAESPYLSRLTRVQLHCNVVNDTTRRNADAFRARVGRRLLPYYR